MFRMWLLVIILGLIGRNLKGDFLFRLLFHSY